MKPKDVEAFQTAIKFEEDGRTYFLAASEKTAERFGKFISYARKPQAFKPGDEWHPFEAKPGETWRSGANSDMIWLWPNIRLGPIRNTACSTTWCGYRNIVGVYCEAKWSSA